MDIIELAKRRGFFWQSSLIHNPIAGFYDYAHLGLAIKRSWENLWRRFFIGLNDNFHEIQPSIIMPEAVFKASGHLENFVDPIVKCEKCKNSERADRIMESVLKENFEGFKPEELTELIKKHNIKCSKCGGSFEKAGVFNMLFPMNIGAGDSIAKAYLTGETAQGAFVNFSLEFEALRRKIPMGLAVIGKAFRNEISPRNAIIRMREFNQAELQIFFDPDMINEHEKFDEIKNHKLLITKKDSKKIEKVACKVMVSKMKIPKFYVYHMAKIQEFYLDVLKLSEKKFRFRELNDEERAFYNKYHWDIELKLESLGGWREIAGIHYRTDHDLKGHQKVSGQKMEVNIEGKKFIPHVLELSFGVDRNIYALLELGCVKEKERTVLKFPRLVSPFDVGIFPLVKKDKIPEKSLEIKERLIESGFSVFYDATGSIGRRYRRIDEIGCPVGITIDYDSIKNGDCTLRDRDSMKQVRVKINELPEKIRTFLHGEKIEKIGKRV